MSYRIASPGPAKAYLDDWAAAESGWLCKYYREGSDEPYLDATLAVEKALQWVRALAERDFVGTESRLNTIFELLRQIVFGTPTRAALDLLTPAEQSLYQALVTGTYGPAVRLEQERVSFGWLERAL